MLSQIKQLGVQIVDATGNFLLRPPYGGAGFFKNHGPRNQRKIALTFDDGPTSPSTDELLDAMGELGVPGTFFCVGVNIQQNPQLVERAYAEGHVIANHSQHHRRMTGLKPGNDGLHIDACAKEIEQIIGQWPLLYRPPWGWLTPWEGARLSKRGYTMVGWDVYTQDWRQPEVDGLIIAKDTLGLVKPGSILLFHDGIPQVKTWEKRQTIRAIKQLVPQLRAQGYTFVSIPELLGLPAYRTK